MLRAHYSYPAVNGAGVGLGRGVGNGFGVGVGTGIGFGFNVSARVEARVSCDIDRKTLSAARVSFRPPWRLRHGARPSFDTGRATNCKARVSFCARQRLGMKLARALTPAAMRLPELA